jgi:ABC-type Zn2+ transport system substrate-binding protein/surface adhesin
MFPVMFIPVFMAMLHEHDHEHHGRRHEHGHGHSRVRHGQGKLHGHSRIVANCSKYIFLDFFFSRNSLKGFEAIFLDS